MCNTSIKIGLVGVCGAGKTTLTKGLNPFYKNVRQIAQEHSYVQDMWHRLVNPDVLIYLHVSYPVTLLRKPFRWNEKEYQEQIQRLRHANEHADLHIYTDNLSPNKVLEIVLKFLEEIDHFSTHSKEQTPG